MAENTRLSMTEERIVFFGTPDFAAHQLQYLLANKMPIVGVVTTPDRPQGRGRKLKPCAVKAVALAHELPILEPNNLKSVDFQEALAEWKPTLQLVVAFRMLPKAVWNLPPRGTVNLHASYLPQYRGAAPINWVIINGETHTGISTFLLQHEIDTGNVLLREKVPLEKRETAGSLHDKLMHAGAPLLLKTVKDLLANQLQGTAQAQLLAPKEEIKHAPKIFKQDCVLDFNTPAEDLSQKIRGLSPYPGAFTPVLYNGKEAHLKIWMALPAPEAASMPPGTLKNQGDLLLIGTKTCPLAVEKLQLSGKQAMESAAFLRGFPLDRLQIQG